MPSEIKHQDDLLRLVAILHFVTGALTMCFALVIAWGFASVASNREQWANAPGYAVFTSILAIVFIGICISPFLSGYFVTIRAFRLVSILISILFLPFFPIGTIVGIFSLWVLTSPLTKLIYDPPRPVQAIAPNPPAVRIIR